MKRVLKNTVLLTAVIVSFCAMTYIFGADTIWSYTPACRDLIFTGIFIVVGFICALFLNKGWDVIFLLYCVLLTVVSVTGLFCEIFNVEQSSIYIIGVVSLYSPFMGITFLTDNAVMANFVVFLLSLYWIYVAVNKYFQHKHIY